ncbi:hypothetical protein I4U23_002592 [Adineta vaga]|nr:hypothetical protein I4U23_002592 [Adineta vaga]
MSASPTLTTSMAESSSSSLPKEVCSYCLDRPFDLVCTCGDKFDFSCIHFHAQYIDQEFQYVRNVVGERLLEIEQMVGDNSCEDAKIAVESWKRKRIQDINDIADEVLMHIRNREDIQSHVVSLRDRFDLLVEYEQHIVHEQLDTAITLQQQVFERFNQLQTLPNLSRDDASLNSKLLSHLNLNTSNYSATQHETETIESSPYSTDIPVTNDEDEITGSISHPATPEVESMPSLSNANVLVNRNSIISAPTATTLPSVEEALLTFESNIETSELIDNHTTNQVTNESVTDDEFEAGYTANIERRNPIMIAADNDKFVGTVCCYENQLLYNNYHQRLGCTRLTLIPDITDPTIRQNIDWTQPNPTISGGDVDWIQDISYSTKLRGYLLLNRARLRLLHSDTLDMEEFYEFPDRSMKRITCDNTYIYLVSASGSISENGDEIILLNYDKEEKICKTFRDIISIRNNRIVGPILGEISDLAVGINGQMILTYRFKHRHEVGICIYNLTNNGNNWIPIKRIYLKDCWHDDVYYTPRTEWCEKLNVFIVIEYLTGHLLMFDQMGRVKGECHLIYDGVRRESPINISISNNNWLCVRYESSINIHRLEDTRL